MVDSPPPFKLPIRAHNLGTLAASDRQPFYAGTATLRKEIEYSHIHHGVEIGATISGEGLFYFNGKNYSQNEGDVYFISGAKAHSHGVEQNGTTFENAYIHIRLDSILLLPPPKSDFTLYKPFLLLSKDFPPVIKAPNKAFPAITNAVKAYSSDDPLTRTKSWLFILEALFHIAEYCRPHTDSMSTENGSRNIEALDRSLDFIHQHWNESLTIGQIAKAAGMSPSHFAHVFTNEMHLSPIDYRNRLRIMRAMEMLTSSDNKVTSIALECGFNSLSQFNTLFRRITGTAPNTFRS
ncbi:MAG: helix-turn-helix domain-containing protein [Fibrobacteres bacterium]|nr:helix-turn-helix domain-containing protein [Fibrobacterota bacterium]